MAKIAYILLCHKDPEAIIQQAERLTAVGDYMVIHFDGRASNRDFEEIRATLKDNPNVCFARRRIKCGWGEWSLVQATLGALEAALETFPRATHFYMLSGDCMAIKTAQYAHDFLDRNDCDFIESFDFFESNWIETGMVEDRLIYRHYFNERKHKRLFEFSHALQKKLGLQRAIPADLQMQIGSQWWCLRRRTIEAIFSFLKKRRDVIRFFRTTWIPDETFFQTLVRHLIPSQEIHSRTLTFLMFTDYGMPVNFYNDHYDLLLGQDFLFARKISPEAKELRRRLGRLYMAEDVEFQISNEGRNLYRFLAGRGRNGRRFAPRFWEAESTLGRERVLVMVVCKKWHLAKRLVERIHKITSVPALGYLFHEADTPLPDLGGIETTLDKRNRHHRALMRMLFDHYDSDRLMVCIDPSGLELIQDFASDRSTIRLLHLDCSFSDADLIAHAERSGLVGTQTPQQTLERILPSIRNDILYESDRIRDADFQGCHYISESGTADSDVTALAEVFGLSRQQAEEIYRDNGLFKD
ncbi:DUF5928 domain-containing protein [Phaeobacter sp. QD34_3]|uniref:DUF5928 domain-containing protein n=1 Tax=unclassified Phaeobacter TaxID=2621772 RepID=UPI00237F29C4|nr:MULTISPECIES: DUF5928 domain-containing protein [unclassified Phaeobacter]MDE4134555.1 DUF5928 domain-containing protein [Phaeobacter sp. QD34_3]MDE4138214.1 DUF5928 domain-containing protein [Phaeobacter sp. QD34_24]